MNNKNILSVVLILVAILLSAGMMSIGIDPTSYLYLLPSFIGVCGIILIIGENKKR